MTRWSRWLVALASACYMVGFSLASAIWTYRRALADVRRRGFEPEQLYVAIQPPLWWYALLILPPAALIAAWIWARRGRETPPRVAGG